MSEFNAKLLEELTLKLIKQNNVNFESGAQFSIKCQFAQVENIVRDAIAEMKTKILYDLQASFDTDMYYSDGGEALIDFESAKCAVEEHLTQSVKNNQSKSLNLALIALSGAMAHRK